MDTIVYTVERDGEVLYVGITRNEKARRKQHRRGFPGSSFNVRLRTDMASAVKAEKKLINKLNPTHNKEGEYKGVTTDKHAQSVSESLSGRSLTEEHKRKIGKAQPAPFYKKRRKVKNPGTGPHVGKTGKDHPRWGKKHSEETKKRLSEIAKERWRRKNGE